MSLGDRFFRIPDDTTPLELADEIQKRLSRAKAALEVIAVHPELEGNVMAETAGLSEIAYSGVDAIREATALIEALRLAYRQAG